MQPVDVVLTYLDRVYVREDVEAIRELCADPYTRHHAGGAAVLSHDEQIARARGAIDAGRSPDGRLMAFTNVLVTADEASVSVLFDMTAPADCPMAAADLPFERTTDEIRLCGTEIFRVTSGRITDVWNPPPMSGHWG